ncbi:MAG: saccharopine dehydrogenase family protein [Candidatus Obscuribacterales bacterium]
MKFLVLGAGKVGHAVVFDLIRSPKVEKVVVADLDADNAHFIKESLADEKIVPVELNVKNEEYAAELMKGTDITVSCLPWQLNYELAKLALSIRANFCDLGGNHKAAEKIHLLDEVAREQEVSIVPNLSMTPGLVSILANCAAESMEELYEIRIRSGSIPVESNEHSPLDYGLFNDPSTMIDEFVEPARVIRDGHLLETAPLEDLEELEFPRPIGRLEAFTATGGLDSLIETYKEKVKHLDYKTLRYPGHCERIKLLKDLGLFSVDPVIVASGARVNPREVMEVVMARSLSEDIADVAIARVTVTGVTDKKPVQHVWECIDYGDEAEGIPANIRLSAFTASIIAQMIARGDIADRGVLRPEKVVPVKLFLAEMASRGISLTMTERNPARSGG